VRKSLNAFIEFFYFPFLRFIPLKTFKYAACGGATVVAELVAYFLSYHFLFEKQNVEGFGLTITPHIAAFLVGFAISFPMGFILNKYIVFTASELRGRIQLFRYGLTVVGSLALNYFFLKLFVEGFGWFATPSKALTTGLVILYSYFTQQYFSFRESPRESNQGPL